MNDFRTRTPPVFTAPPLARPAGRAENFPVASRLLPRRVRAHVLSFYRFARLADDIADDPLLDAESKLAYLGALERALLVGHARQTLLNPAVDLHDSLKATGISDHNARQLLRAFRRDASGGRYATWNDLMGYCRLSAAPVGRQLLELHGEDTARAGSASDALCAALQVLNHLQDCRDDWLRLGRCYLPQVWFDDLGVSVERLVETRADPAIRAVFDRTLDQTERLLERARALPGLITNRGLALEAAVILAMAEALLEKLRREDPLVRRVRLGPIARVRAAMRGIVSTLRRRR